MAKYLLSLLSKIKWASSYWELGFKIFHGPLGNNWTISVRKPNLTKFDCFDEWKQGVDFKLCYKRNINGRIRDGAIFCPALYAQRYAVKATSARKCKPLRTLNWKYPNTSPVLQFRLGQRTIMTSWRSAAVIKSAQETPLVVGWPGDYVELPAIVDAGVLAASKK